VLNTILFLIIDANHIGLIIYTKNTTDSSLELKIVLCLLTLSIAASSLVYYRTKSSRPITCGLFCIYIRMLISTLKKALHLINSDELHSENREVVYAYMG
jgi:hypothetical protein